MQTQVPYKFIQHSSVLIVEPAAEFRIKLAKALQRSGLRVIAVGCGNDALDIARGLGVPSLAIIELALPDMSGLELATKLRAISSCPIMLTLSDPNPELTAQLLDLVAEDVLRKPFDEREMAARAYRILLRRTSRATQQNDFDTQNQDRERLQSFTNKIKINN